MSLMNLPNPPDQGIFILSQRATPTNIVPIRYGEGSPDQLSEIAISMGDEPEVSVLMIQWLPDTNDLYCGIKILCEDHRSGDALCYPLFSPYGTAGWISEQRLHKANIL
jgi:hypothetical protein